MAYASWSVSFGEQPSAAKWNILGTNDATFDSLVGSGTAWASWTPSYSNITLGNGTATAKYQQFGKTVFFRYTLVLGSTTAIGTSPTISLPVTSVSYAGTASRMSIGDMILNDATSTDFYGVARWASTTTMSLITLDDGTSGVTFSTIDATSPFTWTTSDEIHIQGFYEAA